MIDDFKEAASSTNIAPDVLEVIYKPIKAAQDAMEAYIDEVSIVDLQRTVSDNRTDSRIMFTIGKAAASLALLGEYKLDYGDTAVCFREIPFLRQVGNA